MTRRPIPTSPQEELLKHRNVMLFEPIITPETAEKVIFYLMLLNTLDTKNPIHLYLSTYGEARGNLRPIFSIYDAVQLISAPVYTIAIGAVGGGAILLLASGKERYITPNTKLYFTPSKTVAMGSTEDVAEYLQHFILDRKELFRLVAKHSGQQQRVIEQYFENGSILTAEEAVAHGIADKLVKK